MNNQNDLNLKVNSEKNLKKISKITNLEKEVEDLIIKEILDGSLGRLNLYKKMIYFDKYGIDWKIPQKKDINSQEVLNKVSEISFEIEDKIKKNSQYGKIPYENIKKEILEKEYNINYLLPIEEDDNEIKVKEKVKNIIITKDELEKAIKKINFNMDGFCYKYWEVKKKILKKKYKIEWYTPAECNPDTIYD